jgi:hypothetical protein
VLTAILDGRIVIVGFAIFLFCFAEGFEDAVYFGAWHHGLLLGAHVFASSSMVFIRPRRSYITVVTPSSRSMFSAAV